jgi:hypothetical protein
MKLEDIQSEEDILEYIQGTLNDYDAQLTYRNDTEWAFVNLIIFLVKKDRQNSHRGKAPDIGNIA